MFFFGVGVGLRSILRGHLKVGLKRVVHPVSYWRYPVFSLLKQYVAQQNNLKVLDIGSPKLFALYLAVKKKFTVVATDLQDTEIVSVWLKYYNDYIMPMSYNSADNKLFIPEYQDARKLTYPDNYFDIVYSVSVLEHIPDVGDLVAMREIARVLRPGGTAIIEVPFSQDEHDTFVSKDVYEREFSKEPIFYQRHYDRKSVYDRIIHPSGLLLENVCIFKEKLPFELFLSRIPRYCQIPFLFFSAFISKLNHKVLNYNSIAMLSKLSKEDGEIGKDIILFLKKE